MKKHAQIILKPGKEKPLQRYHRWVFTGAVGRIEGEVKDGDWVSIRASGGQFLAGGHYSSGSICARILSFTEQNQEDEQFWQQAITRAVQLREQLGFFAQEHTNAFRLINAEGDGLPGLIVDYYNGKLVMQTHSAGMQGQSEAIAATLRQVLQARVQTIYEKATDNKQNPDQQESTEQAEETPPKILEHGHLFEVDVVNGQKTGFFLDQRDNRLLLARYAKGRHVLNMFCYTGGFSVYAGKAGAASVTSVDASGRAIQGVNTNMALNGLQGDQYRHIKQDAFAYFNDHHQAHDLVVLDPPAFAKHQGAVRSAINAYRSLNKRAIESLPSGGILFTFSCSQLVSRDDFRTAVFSAAAMTGRTVRVLHQLSQPADHPVNLYHPEGEYLKGLVLAVD